MNRIAPATPKNERAKLRYKNPNRDRRRAALESWYWLKSLPDEVLPASRDGIEYTIGQSWLSLEQVQAAFTCRVALGCRDSFHWESPWNDV